MTLSECKLVYFCLGLESQSNAILFSDPRGVNMTKVSTTSPSTVAETQSTVLPPALCLVLSVAARRDNLVTARKEQFSV